MFKERKRKNITNKIYIQKKEKYIKEKYIFKERKNIYVEKRKVQV